MRLYNIFEFKALFEHFQLSLPVKTFRGYWIVGTWTQTFSTKMCGLIFDQNARKVIKFLCHGVSRRLSQHTRRFFHFSLSNLNWTQLCVLPIFKILVWISEDGRDFILARPHRIVMNRLRVNERTLIRREYFRLIILLVVLAQITPTCISPHLTVKVVLILHSLHLTLTARVVVLLLVARAKQISSRSTWEGQHLMMRLLLWLLILLTVTKRWLRVSGGYRKRICIA